MEKIIVYRSQTEAMFDDTLANHPELFVQVMGWVIAAAVAVVVVSALSNKLSVAFFFKQTCGKFHRQLFNLSAAMAGGVITCVVFAGLKYALKFALTF